jgi:tetratricopeptide (TPR) repeat protein
MRKVIFLLLIIANTTIVAQTADSLFVTANNLYKEGKIEQAIETYKKIESQNLVSAELYYNLGNCYYKLNKVGPSIYNYEKALQIDPLNGDVKNNLIFAKRLAIDTIEELPASFLQKFNKNFLQKLSYNQWAILVVFLSFLGSILFLLFYFADIPSRKRLYFSTSILSFLLLITTILITYNQYAASKKHY